MINAWWVYGAVMLVLWTLYFWTKDDWSGMWGFLLVIGALGGAVTACTQSDVYQTHERERKEQEYADSIPRLIRTANGCEVYAFKPYAASHWHYFTRCPNSTVTTDTQHTVRQGKTSHTETTQIVTETR